MKNDNDDYKVGKGKPPKETRFPPKQSGNLAGRPRGSGKRKSAKPLLLAEALANELCGTVKVRDPKTGKIQELPIVTVIAKGFVQDLHRASAKEKLQILLVLERLGVSELQRNAISEMAEDSYYEETEEDKRIVAIARRIAAAYDCDCCTKPAHSDGGGGAASHTDDPPTFDTMPDSVADWKDDKPKAA